MKRRDFLKSAAAGMAAASAAGTLSPSLAQAQEDTLVFGGSVPMSGKAAETGLNVLRGYQCASMRRWVASRWAVAS